MGDFYDIYHQLRASHRDWVHREFAKIGLSKGQPKIISYLSTHDGCIQRELAQNCHVKAPTVTSLLARMEEEGLIIRQSSPDNRRIMHVYLTKQGRVMAQAIKSINEAVEDQAFKGFDESQKKATLAYLAQIGANLSSGGAQDA